MDWTPEQVRALRKKFEAEAAETMKERLRPAPDTTSMDTTLHQALFALLSGLGFRLPNG